jgi:hypothetical protein
LEEGEERDVCFGGLGGGVEYAEVGEDLEEDFAREESGGVWVLG